MFNYSNKLNTTDPEIAKMIDAEVLRQEQHIELIASENYTSPAVMEAQGSQLTNKYAEGYPGKRFYGACEYVDQVEQLASQANQAVYFAMLKPGDKIMGMNLGHGGHLTHGSPANISGKLFEIVAYGLDENEAIDYDEMERVAVAEQPKLLIGGASAYALRFDWERMAAIAKKVGAYFMVDMAHYSGLIAAGVYPNPVPHADFVTSTTHKTLRGPRGGIIMAKEEFAKKLNSSVFPSLQGGPLMHVMAGKATAFLEASKPEFKAYQEQVLKNAAAMAETLTERGLRVISGRTESHVFLVDLRAKGLTGKAADAALGLAHITVNKNAIPNDPESPFVTSGIRVGSPAITTRGFKEAEAKQVANLIADVLDNPEDEANINAVKEKVNALTANFPVYRA